MLMAVSRELVGGNLHAPEGTRRYHKAVLSLLATRSVPLAQNGHDRARIKRVLLNAVIRIPAPRTNDGLVRTVKVTCQFSFSISFNIIHQDIVCLVSFISLESPAGARQAYLHL